MAEALCLPAPIGPVRVRRLAQARRLTLRIRQNSGELEVTAPPRVRQRELERFVQDQAEWIAARRDALPAAILPAPGDQIDILGERLTLAAGRRMRRTADMLELPGEGVRFRAALSGYIKERARDALAGAADRYSVSLGAAYNSLALRDTRARWGSCSSAGRLMFSWRLALAPPDVLDYVVAHEVAHLKEMNHSKQFWDLVEMLRPDYRISRNWLRAHGAELHRYQFRERRKPG